MTFFQFSMIVEICNLVGDGIKYDSASFVYKNKETQFKNSFEIKVCSLTDLFFETAVIFLKKKGSWIKSETKEGYIKINLRNFNNESSHLQNFDVYNPKSWNEMDFYNKKEEKIGDIILNINIIKYEEPLKSMETSNGITGYINKILQSELTTSILEIKNIVKILFQGGISALLKNIIGYLLTERLYHSHKQCNHLPEDSPEDCLVHDCLVGYDLISVDQAKEDLKAARYALAAYLDSFIMSRWIGFGPKKYPDITNSKISAALERAEDIPPENFLKYFEGDGSCLGFVFFIDNDTLVVSLRGTLSHSDILTDFNCGYEQFLGGFAHSGILKLSRKFLNKELGYIREILNQKSLKKILLTGHSLGAAVASILSILIRDFEDLKTYKIITRTFSAPPTVSKDILDSFSELNIVTYNFGSDLITRLSVGSLLDFKYVCISIASEPDLNYNFLKANPAKEEEVKSRIEDIKNHLQETEKFPKLFHPGKIYHIKTQTIDENKIYKFKTVRPEFFSGLTYFKGVASDHLIDTQLNAFNFVINEEKNEKETKNQ